jgi:ABC-type transport system involved in multi-copper enzyme maturation permease subunit
MNVLWTVAINTLREASRKRVLLAALFFGIAFLILFGIGLTAVVADLKKHHAPIVEQRLVLTFITMAGLYAVNFLVIMTATFMPVDTLSGEIASGVMQTVASKPLHRAQIVLGKWAAFAVVILAYLALMAGGTVLVGRFVSGFSPPGIPQGLPLMALESMVLLSLSIAGGTRLSTIANGVTVFGMYGIAFLGGWFEQVGTLLENGAARYIGTIASLLMPSESMWQRAAYLMQPPIMRDLHLSPFSPASLPSEAMVVWAGGYVLAALLFAVWSFGRRPL